jgi:ribosomal protein S18 acetylase RimI-like enzyme
MPRQNRVTPRNELIAVEARGTFTGNRGCLHDDAGHIRRRWDGRRWIVCALRFRDRTARLMEPGLYTHLFFLDEATALAAGHRPCGECRRPAFNAFLAAWMAGNPQAAPEGRIRIDALDRVLHAERTGPRPRAPLETLPDGTFVALDGDPRAFLVLGDALLPWSPEGYGAAIPRPAAEVEVLTPASTVNALRAGYRPVLHETAHPPADAPPDGGIRIRLLEPADVEPILAAFQAADWPRRRETLERYLAEQDEGVRTVLVAVEGTVICGYGTVCWEPDYPPFVAAGIPEIQDLNVLPPFRRRGIATRLMDEAERRIGERGGVAGIGVGLYDDYGPAQRMYVLRGYVPDGRGASHRNLPVRGGETVRADDDLVIHLTKSLRAGTHP